MSLLRNYKVRAFPASALTEGDSLCIMTDSRERALGYWRSFAGSGLWKGAQVELGVQTYTAANIKELP